MIILRIEVVNWADPTKKMQHFTRHCINHKRAHMQRDLTKKAASMQTHPSGKRFSLKWQSGTSTPRAWLCGGGQNRRPDWKAPRGSAEMWKKDTLGASHMILKLLKQWKWEKHLRVNRQTLSKQHTTSTKQQNSKTVIAAWVDPTFQTFSGSQKFSRTLGVVGTGGRARGAT